MKISIMGLGYVGAVSAGCLAEEGHEVIGVDLQRAKVDLVNAGESPIVERDLGDMIAKGVAEGRVRATSDVQEAVRHSDLSLVCVGTPSLGNGHIDLRHVKRVCEQIGEGLRTHPGHTVVVRSTQSPVIRALQTSVGAGSRRSKRRDTQPAIGSVDPRSTRASPPGRSGQRMSIARPARASLAPQTLGSACVSGAPCRKISTSCVPLISR